MALLSALPSASISVQGRFPRLEQRGVAACIVSAWSLPLVPLSLAPPAPMAPEAPAAVSSLGSKLRDQSLGLPQRFRVLFSLRGVGTPEAADALLTALDDPSALCRHEVAFALGQMQTPRAITALAAKLADDTEHSMVRHEAAEALGAIATPECMVLLERYALDKCREVAETCQLAVGRIRYWREERESTAKGSAVATKGSRKETFALAQTGAVLPCSAEDAAPDAESAFLSVDPVPAAPAGTPVEVLRATLLDEATPMFERYRALFALRNRGGPGAAPLLAQLLESSGSALLKHEVCYVLGQLQEPLAVAALERTLEDCSQHAMVRHEAAEALGSIAGPDCRARLQRFLSDPDPVVSEGCLVALDILDYEQSGAFEYCTLE